MKKVKILKTRVRLIKIFVEDVEFRPHLNLISSDTKSESSGNHASHSSGNGYNMLILMHGDEHCNDVI